MPSGKRVTRWRYRRNGSCVSPRSSPPKDSDGRIALKWEAHQKRIHNEWNHWHFGFNLKLQEHWEICLYVIQVSPAWAGVMHQCSLQSGGKPYPLFITGKCQSVGVCPRLTHTVVTKAAVGGARWSEHLAGEAVLELHHLLVDEDFLCARWRSIAGVSCVVYREDSEEKQQDKIHYI